LVRDLLIDQVVTTYYGGNDASMFFFKSKGPAYRIDDVDFEQDPLFRFFSGTEVKFHEISATNSMQQISYRRYFEKRGFRIEDTQQPLLYHYIMLSSHKPNGLFLVPELCQTTGLRSDIFQVKFLENSK
jgi:hypothetical protein